MIIKPSDAYNRNVLTKDALNYFYSIFQIFKQNLITTYGQSFLWFFWIFVIPISKTLLFLFLRKNRVIEGSVSYFPYPLYLFFSLIFWQVFVYIITNSCGILNRYKNLLMLNFPRELIIYGSALVSLFNAFLLLVFFTFISFLSKTPPSIGVVFLPFIFFFIILFALGLAKVISILSSLTHDVSQGLIVLLMFLMFATPSIYSTSSGYIDYINYLNPLHIFIKTAHILWVGDFSQITSLFYFHCFVSLLVFFLGTYFFRKSIYIVEERM